MTEKKKKLSWNKLREDAYKMVSDRIVGVFINQCYDVISTLALILNLGAVIMATFEDLNSKYGDTFVLIETITVAFFALDYFLRLISAKIMYPELSEIKALKKYVFSFFGIVDLLSFLPYLLPFVFPTGATAFRLIRVIRILRLFRINEHFDSLNVITEVLVKKKQQLLSSVLIIMILMVASSLCMYSLEHEAQPDVFKNAFSGMWWSMSTVLTVGYGDIYPVTTMGQVFSIFIAYLGVGMVAIPTGIISAGFVEQYTRLKRMGDYGVENDISLIKIEVRKNDEWNGKMIRNLGLPEDSIIVGVTRGNKSVLPRGNTILFAGDQVLLAAQKSGEDTPMNLQEVVLGKDNPWNGRKIKEIDLSVDTFIVMINRRGRMTVPNGNLILAENDKVFIYHKTVRGEEDE